MSSSRQLLIRNSPITKIVVKRNKKLVFTIPYELKNIKKIILPILINLIMSFIINCIKIIIIKKLGINRSESKFLNLL